MRQATEHNSRIRFHNTPARPMEVIKIIPMSKAPDVSCVHGLFIGTASSVVSVVVLFISLFPIHRFRTALIASLLTLALVDSLSDAYALWNSTEDFCSAGVSMGTKVVLCGLLAFLIWKRLNPKIVYGVAALVVVIHIIISAIRHQDFRSFGLLAIAVVLSLLLNRLLKMVLKSSENERHVDRKRKGLSK